MCDPHPVDLKACLTMLLPPSGQILILQPEQVPVQALVLLAVLLLIQVVVLLLLMLLMLPLVASWVVLLP